MKNIINFTDIATNEKDADGVIICSNPYIINEDDVICIARPAADTEGLPTNLFRTRSSY